VGSGNHPVTLLRDQRHPLAHPRIDNELTRLALQLAEDSANRHPHAGHDGLSMRIHQIRQLLPVTAVEWPHLDGNHQQASSTQVNGSR
jgi:hypothetical protein